MKGVFGSLLKVCFLRLLPFALSADDKDALAAIEKRGSDSHHPLHFFLPLKNRVILNF